MGFAPTSVQPEPEPLPTMAMLSFAEKLCKQGVGRSIGIGNLNTAGADCSDPSSSCKQRSGMPFVACSSNPLTSIENTSTAGPGA